MNIGEAVKALDEGKRIARKGWNGKGLFVFKQVPAEIPVDIIPKMTSLPQSVKDEFARRGKNIAYENQMAIVYPHNVISGWSPSGSDTLANDWEVLD